MGAIKIKAIDVTQPVRGCGTRLAGDAYAVTQTSPAGLPLEAFLIDSPVVVDPESLGLKPLGVTLIDMPDDDGNLVTHVVDWVGATHYENVADFVEEARLYGTSRKLPVNLPFHRLSEKSRILLAHPRAYIENAEDYYRAHSGPWSCMTRRADHAAAHPSSPMCISLCWHDVQGGDPVDPQNRASRSVVRRMPSFEYAAERRPDGVTPVYALALFASFPISRIEVVEDKKGGRHKRAFQAAAKSSLPVVVTTT